MSGYSRQRGFKPKYTPLQTARYLSKFARWQRGQSLYPDIVNGPIISSYQTHCFLTVTETQELKFSTDRNRSGFWTCAAKKRKSERNTQDPNCAGDDGDPCRRDDNDPPSEPNPCTSYLVVRSTRIENDFIEYASGYQEQLTFNSWQSTNDAPLQYETYNAPLDDSEDSPIVDWRKVTVTVGNMRVLFETPFAVNYSTVIAYNINQQVLDEFDEPAFSYTLINYRVEIRSTKDPGRFPGYWVLGSSADPSCLADNPDIWVPPDFCNLPFNPTDSEKEEAWDYVCDCPDQGQFQPSYPSAYRSTAIARSWQGTPTHNRTFGPCKHIYAAARYVGDANPELINSPNDPPPEPYKIAQQIEQIKRDYRKWYRSRDGELQDEVWAAKERVTERWLELKRLADLADQRRTRRALSEIGNNPNEIQKAMDLNAGDTFVHQGEDIGRPPGTYIYTNDGSYVPAEWFDEYEYDPAGQYIEPGSRSYGFDADNPYINSRNRRGNPMRTDRSHRDYNPQVDPRQFSTTSRDLYYDTGWNTDYRNPNRDRIDSRKSRRGFE